MGARYYDPVIGRFLSVDPAGSNPQVSETFNRYAYANNSPYGYLDPDGREVISVSSGNNERLAELINSRTSLVFRFDHNNRLRVVGNSEKSGSSYYSERLNQAISSEKKIYLDVRDVYVAPNKAKYKIDEEAKGGMTHYTYRDGSNTVVISGRSYVGLKDESNAPLRDDAADILAHELVGHSIPRIVGSDTGNAISNENKVRSQNFGPLRMANPKHLEN